MYAENDKMLMKEIRDNLDKSRNKYMFMDWNSLQIDIKI